MKRTRSKSAPSKNRKWFKDYLRGKNIGELLRSYQIYPSLITRSKRKMESKGFIVGEELKPLM